MKLLVALTFNINSVEQIAETLRAIDPPHLPNFDGNARVSIEQDALDVIKFMEEG